MRPSTRDMSTADHVKQPCQIQFLLKNIPFHKLLLGKVMCQRKVLICEEVASKCDVLGSGNMGRSQACHQPISGLSFSPAICGLTTDAILVHALTDFLFNEI